MTKHNWYQIRISPWWQQDHRHLSYVREPHNSITDLEQWRRLGYTDTKFHPIGGDLYDMRNPEPWWIDGCREHFEWQHFSWAVYCMRPGQVLPQHADSYARFKKVYGIVDDHTIHRAIIFLEDWQSGHYFEIDGKPILEWRAGDGVVWRYDTPHLAANMGLNDRYTLQITGTLP